ncbi:MAG: LysM peptidoglycan-binding domain-containing protein [Hydrogenibacillus sp.]|nr:LysM peptidoglycan-binding domain-containing protein [Hydrogenibacillus sp.]
MEHMSSTPVRRWWWGMITALVVVAVLPPIAHWLASDARLHSDAETAFSSTNANASSESGGRGANDAFGEREDINGEAQSEKAAAPTQDAARAKADTPPTVAPKATATTGSETTAPPTSGLRSAAVDPAGSRRAEPTGAKTAEKNAPARSLPRWLQTTHFTVEHRVQPGETWFSLARAYYGTGRYASYLMDRNAQGDGSLRAGTSIAVPNPAQFWHTVRPGDSLTTLSRQYYGSKDYAADIARANGLNPDDALPVGGTLMLRPPRLLVHTVQPGDTYTAISRRYFQSDRLAEAIRGQNDPGPAGQLIAGDVLFIMLTDALVEAFDRSSRDDVFLGDVGFLSPYRLVVDRDHKVLYVYEGDRLRKTFPIAVGRLGEETPPGTYRIITKLEKPFYRAKQIAGGDPKNPLGSHWLGLDIPGTDGSIYGLQERTTRVRSAKTLQAAASACTTTTSAGFTNISRSARRSKSNNGLAFASRSRPKRPRLPSYAVAFLHPERFSHRSW